MKHDVLNRVTGAVQFTADIDCDEGASLSVKLGLSVKWAIKTKTSLAGANLADAYLAGANLAGANLVDGGQRSDRYRFVGSVKDGVLMISAGCRYLSITEAREHWHDTRGGTDLGAETMAILDHIEAVARIRKLLPEATQAAA